MSIEVEKDFVCSECDSQCRILYELNEIFEPHRYCPFCGSEADCPIEEVEYDEDDDEAIRDSDNY